MQKKIQFFNDISTLTNLDINYQNYSLIESIYYFVHNVCDINYQKFYYFF